MKPKIDPQDKKEKRRLLKHEVKQLELRKGLKVSELVDDFADMSIQARNLGRAAKIYESMINDPGQLTIFLGLTGPLVACGLRKVIKKMIDMNMVDVIVSTGAIVYQDIYQALGGKHFKGHPAMDDRDLNRLWVDRIYDTLVDDEKFFAVDQDIGDFARSLDPRAYSSREFLHEIATMIDSPDSIVKTARKNHVPIFVPAINDSSIGIGLTGYYREHIDRPHMSIDSIKDNYEICQILYQSSSTGSIYIGGGVPKNFINDAIVMAVYDFDMDLTGHKYGIQITTALPYDGGLSGSTLKEAISWGKIKGDANISMVSMEMSIGLPLLVSYVLDRADLKGRKKKIFDFTKTLPRVDRV